MFDTQLSKFLGFLFQTSAALFRPFFRYRFGRRYFELGSGIVLPFLLIVLAVLVRSALPQITYPPLALFFPWEQVAPLINAPMLHPRETTYFSVFAVLFLAVAFLQYVGLWISRLRRLDNPGTRSWGHSWLGNVPGLSRLSQAAIQGKIEPALVIGAGYLLLDRAPVFGFYLMMGGAVYGWDNAYLWRQFRARELDARDALTEADYHRAAHEVARAHVERVRARSRGRIATQTLTRIQTTPHAMLALTPEETVGAVQALGATRFVELLDTLPRAAQQQVYARLDKA